jgi:hypothetical protein
MKAAAIGAEHHCAEDAHSFGNPASAPNTPHALVVKEMESKRKEIVVS